MITMSVLLALHFYPRLPFCLFLGDIGELDYSNLDEASKPNLRIVDRVANMTELYVRGDSVWVEQVMAIRLSCLRYRVSCVCYNIMRILALFNCFETSHT